MPRPRPTPDDAAVERLRAELRRLWAALPGGRWALSRDQVLPLALVAFRADGSKLYLSGPQIFGGETMLALIAEMHNALPALYAEIDRLRRALGVPVVGDVIDGRVIWRATRAA